jgi:glycosyltransferase involved in cell wall biosynthesis
MSTPVFSIIVPSYNQARFLEANLASILSQDVPEFEVIVHDAASTDGSVDILRNFEGDPRLQWASARDFGQAHAINKGLRNARGRILAYLNSDDVYFPGAFSSVLRAFEEDSSALFVYGRAHHLREDGTYMEDYPTEPWDYDRLQWICYICQPAVFWRREALDRFGYFDDTLHFAMDYEFWLRAGAHSPFLYLDSAPLAGSRLHEETKTLSQRVKVHREILSVVKRHAASSAAVINWLRHTAHHQSEAAARETPPGGIVLPHSVLFARELLGLMSEFGVLPDRPLLHEIDRIIADHSHSPDAHSH